MTCIDCREENSDGRSIFFNAGDGPLFLSRITVQTAMIRYTEKDANDDPSGADEVSAADAP